MKSHILRRLPWGRLANFVKTASAAMILSVSTGRPAGEQRSRVLCARVAVVLLLFALAGLSTTAKDSQYLPRHDSARHVSQSTKMNVASASFVFDRAPQQATRMAPPRPAVRTRRVQDSVDPLTELIAVTVSMQHRSPPDSLA